MIIAAYQFDICGRTNDNLIVILKAIREAASKGVDLIVFPECALSGYPPYDRACSDEVDEAETVQALKTVRNLSDELGIHVILGTVAPRYREKELGGPLDRKVYNRAYLFSPGKPFRYYGKRALYGWDEENFHPGSENGVFEVEGCKIGVRICFEVRFPEYFRELYKAGTDLNIVLFYDFDETDNRRRYDMIKGHLITRAVENVTPFLSVNVSCKYETAPTCFIDASGYVLAECNRNDEKMLIYSWDKREPNFGEIGRKYYSDLLTKESGAREDKPDI